MMQESQASASAAVVTTEAFGSEITADVSTARPRHTVDPRIRGRMPALDGVRGLAILMVLVVHFFADTIPTNAFERGLVRVTGFGEYGVNLFFVLSGFLITGILVDSKSGPGYFRNFYMRRALRIFPLYYGVLFLIVVVAPLVISSVDLDVLRSRQAWAWLYGINIYSGMHKAFCFPYIDHFWSLAVEEHFYFFWPLVVWLCSTPTLLRVCVFTALASMGGRMLAGALGMHPLALNVYTPFCLDGLFFGAGLAVYARHAGGLDALVRITRQLAVGGAIVFAASLAASAVRPELFGTLRQLRASLFTVFLGAMMVEALIAKPGSFLARFFGPKMQFLGMYSYGLYVFHHLISAYYYEHQTEFALGAWLGSHTVAVFLQATVGMAASLGIAMVSYHVYEKRFLALKRRWEAAPAPGAQLETR
jgi:peptidoglycan/LPS O-acetylase OafA/YrhL